MGYTEYSVGSRSLRAASMDYFSAPLEKTFTQQKEKKIHEEMNPKNLKFRECRDSDVHPHTVPILFWLDVTGSMMSIPETMIKDGLPTMMTKLIQGGVPDASLLFGGVGDHETDRGPLQVGQFESGDAELDMWLTRTWLEKGGGANAGESYGLAYYIAAFHTATDAWDKRKEKGFLFTVGDEPFLKNYPMSAIRAIMGDTAAGQYVYTMEDLYKAASEKYHIYHFHVNHGARGLDADWKELLGQNVIETDSPTEIPHLIATIVAQNSAYIPPRKQETPARKDDIPDML